MAQTRRKRRTKHRGNAAGQVEQRGRTSRPPSPEERKAQRKQAARSERQNRYAKPPSWQRAAIRSLVTTALFVVFVIVALGQSIAQTVALAGFLFLLYVPLGYYTDMFFYRRFQGRQGQPRGRR
jgi:Flp pilus assembly protein TadB